MYLRYRNEKTKLVGDSGRVKIAFENPSVERLLAQGDTPPRFVRRRRRLRRARMRRNERFRFVEPRVATATRERQTLKSKSNPFQRDAPR